MPAGRPSIYTEELVDTICQRIAAGDSLTSICADADMPDKVTVLKWLNRMPEFVTRYAQAREEQADHIFDEIVEIADKATAEDQQVARLRIDARKWVAAKLRPKKYGERIEHAGPDGGPIQVTIASADAKIL